MSEPSKISLYIKDDFKKELKIKAAKDDISISKAARYFLENWNFGAMGFTEYKNRIALPEISGIYFIISNNTVKYIGRSVNIRRRFCGLSHHKHELFETLIDPVIHWIFIKVDELADIENSFIEIIDPEYNGSHFESKNQSKHKEKQKTTTTAIWNDTLIAIREIRECTGESQVSIFHRLVKEELHHLTSKN